MDAPKTVAASEFTRNFGRYRMRAQRGAVAVSSHGHITGYFVGPDEFEEFRRVRDSRRSFATAELSEEKVKAISASRMDQRHKHLGGGIASQINYRRLSQLSEEFTEVWHRLQALYLDAVAGFAFVHRSVEAEQAEARSYVRGSELDSEDFQDTRAFTYSKIFSGDFATSGIHQATQGEVRVRNAPMEPTSRPSDSSVWLPSMISGRTIYGAST